METVFRSLTNELFDFECSAWIHRSDRIYKKQMKEGDDADHRPSTDGNLPPHEEGALPLGPGRRESR